MLFVVLNVLYQCSTFCVLFCFFFFNDTATTEIYTLSLHDALPIWPDGVWNLGSTRYWHRGPRKYHGVTRPDRKSTRLNSSHPSISYAVFCLKKKNHPSYTMFIQKKQHQNSQYP